MKEIKLKKASLDKLEVEQLCDDYIIGVIWKYTFDKSHLTKVKNDYYIFVDLGKNRYSARTGFKTIDEALQYHHIHKAFATKDKKEFREWFFTNEKETK